MKSEKICLCAVNASYTHTSFAMLRLKSVCVQFKPVCVEFTINDSVERVCSALFKLDCDVYAFGCYIWNLAFLEKLTARLKAVKPACEILFGGPEIGYDTELFMEKHPYVDYCLRGEGEESLTAFLRGESLSEIDGLCYREDGKICIKPPAYVSCLEALPPVYDTELLESLRGKMIYYETSRGCPFRCSYCLSSTEHRVRYFPETRVLADFKLLMEAEVPLVKLTDRTFNLGDARTSALLRFIMEHNRCTCFHFEISAAELGEETMRLLETAPKGMFQLEIGVQSTNAETSAAIDRHADFEKICTNVLRLRKAQNMHMHLDLIAGLPYEDYSSFRKSFNDVFALEPDMLQLGFLKLLKGTKIRTQAEAFDYIYTAEPPYEVLQNKWISYAELLKLKAVEHVLELYYNSGHFSSALRYSMRLSGLDAFSYFEKLAAFSDAHTKSGASLAQSQLFSLFYAFHTQTIAADDGLFNALLVYDYLKSNKTASPATWAKLPEATKAFYTYAWQRVRESGCLPEALLALKQKDLMQYVRVLRMEYDVFTQARRDSILVIDYKNKKTYSLAVENYEEHDLR